MEDINVHNGNNSGAFLSKSNIESHIAALIIKLHKEVIGRGPHNVKVDIFKDMIIIRLKGVLATSEKHVAESVDGDELIRGFRRRIAETSYPIVIREIEALLNTKVLNLFTDIVPLADEKVTFLTLENKIEEKLSN